MYRGDVKEEYLEAALMGGHGSAASIMLSIGSGELAAAATEGDGDGRQLANFWYLPGDFAKAVEAADALSIEGSTILSAIANLAVVYRAEDGEILFRLACERRVLEAMGEEWHALSFARQSAWLVFGLVANRVYGVLEAAPSEVAGTAKFIVPALAETIFDEDKEPDIDADRQAATKMMEHPKPPKKARAKAEKAAAGDDADADKHKAGRKGKAANPAPVMSVATPPADLQLPPETDTNPND